MTIHESDKGYLESWSDELIAKANRIRQLIGNRHWLTDGHHKEVIVREFLYRYLPPTLVIGSGFIKDRSGFCSPEIDILISDFSKHPAYFNEGGIQILPPSSVVAYIEMKSKYSPSVLDKALKAISKTQKSLIQCKSKKWRCICFANITEEFDSFHETTHKKIKAHIEQFDTNDLSTVKDMLPTCISSFDKYILFIKEDSINKSIILNFFDYGKLSTPMAFSDLFEEVRVHFGNTGDGDLSSLSTNLNSASYFRYSIEVDNK